LRQSPTCENDVAGRPTRGDRDFPRQSKEMMMFKALCLISLWIYPTPADLTKARPEPLHEHPTLVQMLDVNNELRATRGLSRHRISPELTKAAQKYAQYMAQTGSFSHYSNGSPMYRAQANDYWGLVRENIAYGTRNVSQTFSAWRNSGGHWASIVSDTQDVGFGYAIGPNGAQYWVAMYGYSSAEPSEM
jgi:uncharacterized protein YkwD